MAEEKRGRDLLQQAKMSVPALDPEQVHELVGRGEPAVLVDVREGDEWRAGHLPGAVHIPRGFLELQVDEKLPDKDAPIIVYCAGGNRSALASKTLEGLGYSNVRHMTRGFTGWRDAGFEVVAPKNWTPAQRERYSRHFVLPEVGEQGQVRIGDGKVLVVGAGGLGAPALYYLAAAGVGKIGIIDFDSVEESNLQRQIIHSTSRIGVNKATSAASTIADLNPNVEIQTWTERLTDANVDEIVSQFDIVIDATDNFKTRYRLNEAAVRHGKPYIYGSIFRFEGYVSVFWPERGGPCYRCMHPAAPPEHLAPNCSEAGVLGVLPGIIGTIQANEALKILVGYGEPLVGRLLTFDAQPTHFGELKLKRDPQCATCGTGVTLERETVPVAVGAAEEDDGCV
jgi:sulfur-carrier protein adenylyltransferase/sulfurtransferase